MAIDCSQYPLSPTKVVAIAKDTYLTPTNPFPDTANLPGVAAPKYGQDITSSIGRAAPGGQSVATSPADLAAKMRKLLSSFASGDKSKVSVKLFDEFLKQNMVSRTVIYFDDPRLNDAASKHKNIIEFRSKALSAPNSPFKSSGNIRIHQALKNAGWDIKKMIMPTDLGVPAFNVGSKAWGTDDFNNGLGLMINGVQYVYVVATHYFYSKAENKYCITLKFIFYDVFGLDDDDLKEFGASKSGITSSAAGEGITAWWQLQHQYGYAPLVTRIILTDTYEVSTL